MNSLNKLGNDLKNLKRGNESVDEILSRYGILKLFKVGDPLLRVVGTKHVTKGGDSMDLREQRKLLELLSSDKAINEIQIICGAKTYKFKRDRTIIGFFAERLEELSTGYDDKQLEKDFQHVIQGALPLYERLNGIPSRKRYLLIYDLLQLAGYPFHRQQSEQSKAALIRNMLTRNKKVKNSL